ncbi:MAG: HEAT repeat domain-containing protein [Candidatus Electrothrix sp. AUS4]|nr:HEAT repeat domain-containing protein [Candidatus Electrothrix sp. AUS4]
MTFLEFVVLSLLGNKAVAVADKYYEETECSFASLCKINKIMELKTCDGFVDLTNKDYYEEFYVVFNCVISELQLCPDEIIKEANKAIGKLKNEEDTSLLFNLLTDIDITVDWKKVKLADTEKKIIASALDHPSEIIARTAAEIIATGAGGDETAEAVKEILRTGRDSALYFISQIASNVWREKAPEIILYRLEEELTDGCQYLLENLPKISNDQYDDRISTTLLRELTHPDVEIALGAAKGYANHHPAQAHLNELKKAFSYWKENEEPYPVKTGTVPPSPRETLVQVIDRLNGFTLSELAELCGDPRRDVEDVARDALLRLCKSDESALNDVIGLIQQEQAPISLLAKLTELPPEILRNAEKRILALLDSPVPELRTETLKMLHGGWLADETARELTESFLDDPDVHVRNQAVAALRKIASHEPA